MSGPVSMALGPYQFEALGFGYEGVGRDLDTQWSEVKVADGWDRLQWVGPGKDEVTIKGVLFPHEFGGVGTLEGIRQAAIAGDPLMLVTLAGNVFGLHVVTGVKEDQSLHMADGFARRNAYQLALRYYSGDVGAALQSVIRLFTG